MQRLKRAIETGKRGGEERGHPGQNIRAPLRAASALATFLQCRLQMGGIDECKVLLGQPFKHLMQEVAAQRTAWETMPRRKRWHEPLGRQHVLSVLALILGRVAPLQRGQGQRLQARRRDRSALRHGARARHKLDPVTSTRRVREVAHKRGVATQPPATLELGRIRRLCFQRR